jgi:hypothetical protein
MPIDVIETKSQICKVVFQDLIESVFLIYVCKDDHGESGVRKDGDLGGDSGKRSIMMNSLTKPLYIRGSAACRMHPPRSL